MNKSINQLDYSIKFMLAFKLAKRDYRHTTILVIGKRSSVEALSLNLIFMRPAATLPGWPSTRENFAYKPYVIAG